jgi:hypothetical protein
MVGGVLDERDARHPEVLPTRIGQVTPLAGGGPARPGSCPAGAADQEQHGAPGIPGGTIVEVDRQVQVAAGGGELGELFGREVVRFAGQDRVVTAVEPPAGVGQGRMLARAMGRWAAAGGRQGVPAVVAGQDPRADAGLVRAQAVPLPGADGLVGMALLTRAVVLIGHDRVRRCTVWLGVAVIPSIGRWRPTRVEGIGSAARGVRGHLVRAVGQVHQDEGQPAGMPSVPTAGAAVKHHGCGAARLDGDRTVTGRTVRAITVVARWPP